MKILYSYRAEEERASAAERLSDHDIVFHQGSLQDKEWSGGGVECLRVFVDSQVGKEEFNRLPDLKLIATSSTGFDHIDTTLARERAVAVATVPSYGEHTVAEFAFALLLMLSRNMFFARERVVRDGSFSPEGLTGFDLFGKTIGIVGTGRIGKNAIRIAKGFSMNILAFDAYPDSQLAQELGFKYVSLDELLKNVNIVSLHLPENKDTHYIINKERVEKMKRGMVFINTARGSLVDTRALVWGLEQNIISAAGIDVLSEEGNVADEMRLIGKEHPNTDSLKTLLFNHYLIDHPRVIITPHTAFNTKEALQRIFDVTIENIRSFAGGNPQNILSL